MWLSWPGISATCQLPWPLLTMSLTGVQEGRVLVNLGEAWGVPGKIGEYWRVARLPTPFELPYEQSSSLQWKLAGSSWHVPHWEAQDIFL